MKFKLLFLTTLLLSTHVFAADKLNKGVELLQHTETRGEKLPDKFIQMPSTNSTSTSATANPASGSHESQIYASGYVSAYMHNTSQSSQVYYVDRYMCIENSNCVHTRDSYQLSSGTNQTTNANISTSAYISQKGRYEDEAVISISGYESDSAKGTNTVTVS